MFIDVHCHVDLMKNPSEIIKRAKGKNVEIVNNSINLKSNRETLILTKKFGTYASLGIYPIDSLDLDEKQIKEEIEFIKRNKESIFAIGEVGIDLKWSKELEKQKNNFQKFIELAKEIDKPLIVHSRKAEKEVIKQLEKNKCKKVIVHCFNGNLKQVKQIIENGWFLSIPANVTFNKHFQKIVEIAPIENLFCETDSPYLHPIKGEKNNEPKNVIESYKKISEIKKVPLKKVEEKICENFLKIK